MRFNMAKRLYKVDPIERFNQKYIVDEETGCWKWQGSLNKDGYGQIRVNNKMLSSHRFSYDYFIGNLNPELEICHNCQDRSCVNPNHLRQDTKSSNMIDCLNIGKLYFQKLTYDQIVEIKNKLKNNYYGQINDLAKEYNVGRHTISRIKTNKNWSHVQI